MSATFDEYLRERNLTYYNSEREMWGFPYFQKLMDAILNGDNIDAFIQQKNQDLYKQYSETQILPERKALSEKALQTAVLQKFSTQLKNNNDILNEFEKDIGTLQQYFSDPQQQSQVKSLLSSYKNNNGKFAKNNYSYRLLTQKPKGLFNRLLNGKKHKQAQQYLASFIEKYEELNIPNKIQEMSNNKEFGRYASNLELKFNRISDIETSDYFSEQIQQDNEYIDEQISFAQKYIKSEQERIQSLEKTFTNSAYIPKEAAVIRSFCDKIRDEVKNPKTLNSSDYVEGLDKLPDDEVIMFNIGLQSGKSVGDKAKNIMSYNGLSLGNDADKWLLRQETNDNSDRGKYEIFSPLMTVKEAKEIMPKLMANFDQAHISSGLAVPMKAKDIFKENSDNSKQAELSQENLNKLIMGALIKDRMQNNPLFDSKKAMQMYDIKSEEELPQAFMSLKDISEQYPKDKFLFSGSTASDNYLAFSARAGRNGLVYATPDISYAAKYDGVTDVGSTEGSTATGDRYVSSIIGQISGHDVKVGFINVYEQNPDDKYFSNFGMEDCRKYIDSDKQPKTYKVLELVDNKWSFSQKQAQTDTNLRLTRDQAINGYIGSRTVRETKDGEHYFTLSFDAETYVTQDKNPLKAQIMHIKYNGEEFFIPVPNKPNETIQAILNKRQAKMEDTFSHNSRQDILNRMQKQNEEFHQGNIPTARENNFIRNRQEKLSENKNSSDILHQPQKDIAEKSLVSNTTGKHIETLRGLSAQTQSVVRCTTLDGRIIDRQSVRE